MAESKLVDFFRSGGIKVVTEVVFNSATGSWEMNFKGIEIAGPEGSGVSLEINQSDPSIWQIEGVAGGPIKIGGATNVNQVTGAVSGSNLTIEIPIPGGSIKYKIEPGPLLPHPTDPSAAPIPSATFQPQISLGPVSVELPKSDPISTDNIFDPDVPGSPLSGGMLGNAYGAIRHRQRQLDAQIDAAENGHYIAARHVPVSRDPLVLDLDGDGLELAGASGAVLFDHNADGIKTGTGWARPDDGFLVRDRNGNGTIDTGRELFGVDTVKSNNTLATDGFDALRDLDGNGDGFITSADTSFAELRVWRDANQDGVSQSGELKTLAELNISSIGVNGTATGPQAGQVINNNTVALSATFTQNGQTHTVGAIDLETNNFFTEFPPEVVDEAGNPVVITEQAKGLPQMSGSGMVRNMQAAASLDSSFANTLQTFAETATRDGQRSQLDNLITQWAGTADFPGGIFSGSIPPGNLLFSLPAGITVPEYKNLINVLEAFNGSHFYGDALGGPRPTGYAVTTVSDPGTGTLVHQYIINPLPQQVALLQQAYNAIKESVYAGLVVQTRLSPYLDSIDVSLGDAGVVFDTTAMAALLESRRTSCRPACRSRAPATAWCSRLQALPTRSR